MALSGHSNWSSNAAAICAFVRERSPSCRGVRRFGHVNPGRAGGKLGSTLSPTVVRCRVLTKYYLLTGSENMPSLFKMLLIASLIAVSSMSYGQPAQISYCAGSGPPPPPAACPVLAGAKGECVGAIAPPWYWYSQNYWWTSSPICTFLAAGGLCGSEGIARAAWRSNVTAQLCSGPNWVYSCTDVVGRVAGIDHFLVHQYNLNYGVQNGQNCNAVSDSYGSSGQMRTPGCPLGFSAVSINGPCARMKPEACPVGNPIQCAGGQKTQVETDT